MTDALRLTTVLERRGPAGAVVLSDEQVAGLGGGTKTPPVTVTVNGEYTFAGRVGRRGGENLVGFTRTTRAAAGVEVGDTVEVVITLDAGERSVDVPDDLGDALRRAGLDERFATLAPSHRKEYVRWITEAKKPETRARRVGQALERITNGAGSR